MITPAERIVAAVEQNYMVLPHVQVKDAEGALTGALNDAFAALGWCPDCWGRGYNLDMSDAIDEGQVIDGGILTKPPLAAHAVPCVCERGVALENISHDSLFVDRPR